MSSRPRRPYLKKLEHIIDAHRGGEGGDETAPPRQIFEKLVNKNAINPKIGGPPQAISLKALTPLGILAKTSRTPPPLDFQPVCIYGTYFLLFFKFANKSISRLLNIFLLTRK
jgi:hypothetical protein